MVELLQDLEATVRHALDREGHVNVPAIALELNARHAGEACCVPEMESQVLAAALQLRAVVFFQSPVQRRPVELSASGSEAGVKRLGGEG
ncbi:hypothetical protein [Chelativorans sp. M5D2P16]|uniref:hypothetical protein n=1 Tax=Chelativorans sp. M5D2P16 TaxID=3095678 RepID=UPI002ACA8E51|nr:hypothetical protein [Chelativorans sp. M5D2P16]MDZ5697648.1 hypothetical protein [Chelativorans sp. M5D2P16]